MGEPDCFRSPQKRVNSKRCSYEGSTVGCLYTGRSFLPGKSSSRGTNDRCDRWFDARRFRFEYLCIFLVLIERLFFSIVNSSLCYYFVSAFSDTHFLMFDCFLFCILTQHPWAFRSLFSMIMPEQIDHRASKVHRSERTHVQQQAIPLLPTDDPSSQHR